MSSVKLCNTKQWRFFILNKDSKPKPQTIVILPQIPPDSCLLNF